MFTINECNGNFVVKGVVNVLSARCFRSKCEKLLNTHGELTINIEQITEIDKAGLVAIRTLYDNALNHNRGFYMVGVGCKEIYDEFRYTVAAS